MALRFKNEAIKKHKSVWDKILTRQTADRIIAAIDTENYFYANTLHGTTIINNNFDKFYVLAVLNSQLISWFYKNTSPESNKVFAQIKIDILKKLPIPNIEKSLQNNIVKITGQIIDKKKYLLIVVSWKRK